MGVLAKPKLLSDNNVGTDLEVVRPANRTKFTLDEIRRMIGCDYVEIVRIQPAKILGERVNVFFCDEEFLLKAQEPLVNATAMNFYPGVILGNVVFCEMLNPGEESEMYR